MAYLKEGFSEMEMQGRGRQGFLGPGLRSWIRIDSSGNSQVIEVDKFTIMHLCGLRGRYLRLLDPMFDNPSCVLRRKKAIVLNLEKIRCVITVDVVLVLNSSDAFVMEYVEKLKRQLQVAGNTSPAGYLPFEFQVLEFALEDICTSLDSQVQDLQTRVDPQLDALVSKFSIQSLKRLLILKSELVALTQRVQKVKDVIEDLIDDEGGKQKMHITKRKQRMESSPFHGDHHRQPLVGDRSNDGAKSISAPVSAVLTRPPKSRKLGKSLTTASSRIKRLSSSQSTRDTAEDLELLLDNCFVSTHRTLSKLTTVRFYIDDTLNYINIQLAQVRNQLTKLELLLTTLALVLSISDMVTGVFGMHIPIGIFENSSAFMWILIINGACSILVLGLLLWSLKSGGVIPID